MMIKNVKILFTLLLIFAFFKGEAQFYSTGQDPAKTKWNQINTEHFQIIYPQEFAAKAQYIAKTLDYYYDLAGNSLNHKPEKISVIIHNQTIVSNGYVAWAPKRVELYTTPSQDTYPDLWLNHLCVHELRHVVQIDKLNQGLTKILSIAFGQQATGLVSGHLPYWFLEGDAVGTETAFSKFGRGRLPDFQKGIKANLLSDEKRFSFDQALFGSYKSYTPNRYEMGYQLTSYGRMHYGKHLWSDVLDHVAKNSYTILPTTLSFYRGLKKSTGLSQQELYVQTMDYLQKKWEYDEKENNPIKPKFFNKNNTDEYCNYYNPIYLGDEQIISLKKSYSQTQQFVLISKEDEKVLWEPGIILDNTFSYSKNIIVWAEYKPDPRWQNREFNSIKAYNIVTGTKATIIEKGRCFSPTLSHNAEKVALIEVDQQNKTSLVFISIFNDRKTEKVAFDNHLMRPAWSMDDSAIYAIEITEQGKQVIKYNLSTKKKEVVYKAGKTDIQRVMPRKSKLYFHATYNGVDNIYVYDYLNKETYQLSNSLYGITDFDIDTQNKNLYVSDYTTKGTRIGVIPIEKASWKRIDKNSSYKNEFADVLASQENVDLQASVVSRSDFQEKPYRKVLNLFNFHSWVPFSFDYQEFNTSNLSSLPSQLNESINPGLMLLSQNKLSTVESIINYGYKNGNHVVSSSIELKGQYPVFKFSSTYGEQQLIYKTSSAYWQPQAKAGFKYQADVYVPLNLTSGKYIKAFVPLLSIEYDDNLYYNYQDNYYVKGLETVRTQLLYYAYQQKAAKDIIPKLGMIVRLNLYNTPFESELFNYIFNANAIFYLPGKKNRGFQIDFGYQYQNPNLYLFGSKFNFPRGTQVRRTEKMVKLYTDYVFPIAYPEWNLGSVLYLKRLRGNAFVDYAYNSYRTLNASRTAYVWPNENILSCGLELKADYHLLRTIFPLTTGVRVGYAPTESAVVFDVLFGIDLNGF